MKTSLRPTALLSLCAVAVLTVGSSAAAKPTQIDSYCSPSGDYCQEVVISKKSGQVKFTLFSFTPAVQGDYTLCVKGPHGKECKDFVLELQAADALIYSDKVNWQQNFPSDFGNYLVKWKYMGERLGHKLRFEVEKPGEEVAH